MDVHLIVKYKLVAKIVHVMGMYFHWKTINVRLHVETNLFEDMNNVMTVIKLITMVVLLHVKSSHAAKIVHVMDGIYLLLMINVLQNVEIS